MALEYVVTKRVFGFDQSKTEKYVARSVGSGQVRFDKMCAKVSRLCGCDKFHMVHPDTDWLAGLRHAEKIGLGTMDYELIKI